MCMLKFDRGRMIPLVVFTPIWILFLFLVSVIALSLSQQLCFLCLFLTNNYPDPPSLFPLLSSARLHSCLGVLCFPSISSWCFANMLQDLTNQASGPSPMPLCCVSGEKNSALWNQRHLGGCYISLSLWGVNPIVTLIIFRAWTNKL